VKQAIDELVRFLDDVDVGALAADLASRRQPGRPRFDGHLLELDRLGSLDDDARVRRRPAAVRSWSVVDERVRLDMADRTVDLPAVLVPAVERLLDGRVHRVGELGDLLDASSRLVLVRRLVREGILRSPPPVEDHDG
jgi:hypothetical protein